MADEEQERQAAEFHGIPCGLPDDKAFWLRVDRLIAAVEGECHGLAIDGKQAAAILAYVDGPAD